MKWTGFAAGLAAGLAVVAVAAAVGTVQPAHAAPQSVDNNGKFVVAVGGSQQGISDLLWVLHEHPPHPGLKGREEDHKVLKGTRISLCLYKAAKNGDAMKLMSARDIAYDIEFMDFNQESPTVATVIQTLAKQIKDKDK